ncbi:hemerythrin domain-containing protein [Nitrogeniibacter aestuarii]|uniref:hemerythrin domain-containing protein n=1 Tax=Nitrogeniibacter aestuarii TaxID=2815343 RepID=UPI001D103BB4|nr:hemerythrin domain-containing protein [Nitrogeniibacter aestuarii]
MKPLAQTMRLDHARCDLLFSKAEAAAEDARWPDCQAQTHQFVDALLQHFALEEDVLFPAFERRTGMTGGPTQVMRSEHDQMRQLVAALNDAASSQDADAFADAAETLLILMQQHNMKEENILYPMVEDSVGAEPDVQAGVESLAQEAA